MSSDRFSVKQLGSIAGDIANWPGDIKVWHARVTTAVAPVAALPTTAAHASLWNGNPQGSGKNLIILAAGTVITTSAGAAINLGLAAHVTTALVTAMAGTAASAITPLTGNASYGGLAQFKSAVTIVNDGLWHPIARPIVCANTANLMLSVEADLAGRYVIQPGQQFSLASLCNAAGSAVCMPWVIWAEATFND